MLRCELAPDDGEEKVIAVMRRLLMLALVATLAPVAACGSDDDGSVLEPDGPVVEPDDVSCALTCRSYFTAEQKAVIADYVEAWNAQDVDAIVALFSPDDTPLGDPRCRHNATIQSGLRLTVDSETCSYALTNPDGTVLPTVNQPCMLSWGGFDFADDGEGSLLRMAPIPNEVVLIDDDIADVLDDKAHDALECR